jgi:TatD-related deoxyribonuclease
MYILDNHLHLRPWGSNVEVIKEFEKQGGTHAILVRLPQASDQGDYSKSYDDTLAMAEKVRKETDVKVFVALGPYPVELIHFEKKHGLEKATEMMKEGVDLAASYVKEGKAIAIGEVGRPHFNVDKEIIEASNGVMYYAMCAAKDAGCPVILHTERATLESFKELAEMADKAGLEREKVVKHFSPPIIDEERNRGLFPSIIGSEKNTREAISQGDRFFMESDYIDDPRRPGAVIPPATIPKKTKKLMAEGVMTEEQAARIHNENAEKVYGIQID